MHFDPWLQALCQTFGIVSMGCPAFDRVYTTPYGNEMERVTEPDSDFSIKRPNSKFSECRSDIDIIKYPSQECLALRNSKPKSPRL
jgi:hypothetical protein